MFAIDTKTIRSLVVALFFLLARNADSQIESKHFLVHLDAAQFQDESGKTYVEIYYAIPEQSIAYIQGKSGFGCEILANLTIHYFDSIWVNKLWKIQRTVPDTSQLGSKHLVDLLRYPLDQAGHYKMVLRVRDLHAPAHNDSAVFYLNARTWSPQALALSDLEIASGIQKANPNSAPLFLKYSYEVCPNPVAIFGAQAPEFYYYFESYHVLENIPGDKYKILTQIKSYNGPVIENITPGYRSRLKRQAHEAEFGKINVASLPTGKYLLVVGLCDSLKNQLVGTQKEFYIYNPAPEAPGPGSAIALATPEMDLDFLFAADAQELNREFDKMGYLMPKNQKSLYKSLDDVEARKKLLYSVWRAVTPAGDSPVQFRQKYLERIDQAEQFAGAFKDGWKTDRGRIFVLYGPPSNIQRFPSTTSTRPYEIWEYENLQSGVYFVFIDRMGLNNLELFHSTLEGELQNPGWQKLISTSIQMY